jgi:hypothetical protein
MKIQKAIMSVDDNPLYSDFWSLVSMVWKNRFNIDPVLIYFGSDKMDEKYGEVKYVKPIENIPIYLQTQWARMWFTSTEKETTFITSDIDIFPIRKDFFIDQVKTVDDNKYVHLFGSHRPLPICYHVAKGKMFKKVLQLDESFEESMNKLLNSESFRISHMGFDKWGLDESYSTAKILNHATKEDILLLPNNIELRLDRANWPSAYKVDNYIDSHSLRPVKDYFREINDLMKVLL